MSGAVELAQCTYPAVGTIRDAIVEMAARPAGVSGRELKDELGMAEGNVPPNMQALEYQGRVLRAKTDGQRLRWFKHPEHRDAWMTAMKEARGTTAQVEAAAKQARAVARKAAGDKRRAAKLARSLAAVASATASATEAVRLKGQREPDALPGSVYTAGSSKTAPKIKDGPVDYSQAVYTIDDKVRPTARWQMQASQPAPGFSGMGIGRYL